MALSSQEEERILNKMNKSGKKSSCASLPLKRTNQLYLTGLGGPCAMDSLALSLGVKPKDVVMQNPIGIKLNANTDSLQC